MESFVDFICEDAESFLSCLFLFLFLFGFIVGSFFQSFVDALIDLAGFFAQTNIRRKWNKLCRAQANASKSPLNEKEAP